MTSGPSTDGSEARPSKSPLERNASLVDPPPRSSSSSSSNSRNARSRSTFSLEIPAYTGTQRARSTGNTMATSRAGSAAPPPPSADATSDNNNSDKRGGSKEGSAAPAVEAVKHILKVQKNAGMEASFLCELEGGRKVQRSRSALSKSASSPLADFEATQPASEPSSPQSSASASGSSDIVVRPRGRAVKSTRGQPAGKKRQQQPDEDEEMEDGESSSEGDNEKDGDVEEPSSSEEDDDDDGDDCDEDDLNPRRSSRNAKNKARAVREGSRHSSRNGGARKHYDFGDGAAIVEDEDDGMGSSSGSEHHHATRASTRSTRSTSSLTTSSTRNQRNSSEGEDSGESSDELSMRAVPKKAAQPQPKRNRAVVTDSDEYDELAESEASASSSRRSSDAGDRVRPQDLHRDSCAKCNQEPASELFRKFRARKSKKKPGRQRKRDILEEDTDAEEDRLSKLGAWVECGICCSAYHFGCLPAPQKKEITDSLKAEHEAAYSTSTTPAPAPVADGQPVDEEQLRNEREEKEKEAKKAIPKREKEELNVEMTFELRKCPACKKQGGRRCFVCGVSGKTVTQREVEEYGAAPSDAAKKDEDVEMVAKEGEEGEKKEEEKVSGVEPGLMFRCTKCKRIAHYGCLENDEPEWTFEQHAQSYFDWQICHDCYNFNVPLDAILAWAEADPLPAGKDDVESDDEVVEKVVGERRVDAKTQKVYDIPAAKDLRANAKYLVKWKDMSYRRLEWVPHAWLSAAHFAKLSNFLTRGSTVSFEPPKDDELEDGEDEEKKDENDEAPLPDSNAMDRIPKAWRTVDRVLEVWYDHPKKEGEEVLHDDYIRRYDLTEDADEAVKLVSQCKIKWGDLPYAQCTDEAPPKPDEEGYDAFVDAYKAFLIACDPKMSVPSLTKKQMAELDEPRDPKRFVAIKEQPSYITGGKLMDFQIEGVNFLRYQWWQRKGCILADEMGLGKTCQIISFLSYLNQDEGARPFLVVVPNSLIGNWMREFAKWAPAMRVVPYNGDADSRQIVEQYELFDAHGSLKTHVVLVTYEALQGNTRVFRRVGRWEAIVIDEGQRLKSGKSSLLYTAIESLNVCNRILLSGTPLNNNLREVFNLLAFINPKEIPDVDVLTERFAELTPALVEEVRGMLKPYFLRRTKNLVLNLPPLNETVVPVTMTVLQRQIYRGILERNSSAIASMVQKTGSSRKPKKSNTANILMELRKTLCHPYLNADIEPRQTSAEQAHINLTEASAKLVLLQRMLPKLKEAGHRVLIFSQFKITLNILERFLSGLKLKYLRLDGDTPQIERQRDVDKYNAAGSEYFVYLLSTRAGGVGLNITSADIVIIYDQDFNPQMDLQAISRAHRIGQTKPVRVFKLMVKHTCEEKIFAAGRKKLGLEHLIIQRIDAQDETEDVESMLQHGAELAFDEEAAEKDAIRYSDGDIDALLKKTAETTEGETDAAGTFAEAQIWSVQKGGLDDAATIDEPANEGEQKKDLHDFWSKIVSQQQEAERQAKAAQAANVGRGKRKRAQVNYTMQNVSPQKNSKKKKDSATPSIDGDELSSGDEYRQKRDEIDSDDEWAEPMDLDDLPTTGDPLKVPPPLARLEPSRPGTNTPIPDATKPKKSQTKLDPSDPAYAAAVEDKKKESKKKTTVTLGGLISAALQAGDTEVYDMLMGAYTADSRTQQTTIMLQAARILRAKAKALKAGGPLAPLPGVANQAAPSAPSQHAPRASTSGSAVASSSISGMAPPAVRPPPLDPAAAAAHAAAVEQSKREKAERKRLKEEVRRQKEEQLRKLEEEKRVAAEAAAQAKAAREKKRAEHDFILAEQARRKAQSDKERADWVPPTAPGDPRLAPSIAAGAATKAPSPTSGQLSDGSSGGRSTPRMKQQTLSFAKKPSPPTPGASGSSQPAASTSQAAPAKRPSPPSSSSSSKAIPAKRPSPSSSAPAAKKPTPPKKPSPPSETKKKSVVIDLISGSEEE